MLKKEQFLGTKKDLKIKVTFIPISASHPWRKCEDFGCNIPAPLTKKDEKAAFPLETIFGHCCYTRHWTKNIYHLIIHLLSHSSHNLLTM